MRWIYISAHLDDAVLSCGGLIWEQCHAGTPVEIWTVVCGFPPAGPLSDFARVLHFLWGTGTAEDTVALRREEDRLAARILSATVVHFDVPDSIYRRSAKGEPLYEDVFMPIHPSENDMPEEIAASLAGKVKPDDTLVCPMTIGGHVDHVIVHHAVERLGRPLLYYPDVPYVLNHPDELVSVTSDMKALVYPVSEDGLHTWQEGIAAYASQISTLFESPEGMREAIRAYWQKDSGIYLWQKQ